VLSIGQLARYVGVSTKTIRVYHDKGLLPEPHRDRSGYRRYTAQDAAELIKIRTLAEAGVPLARVRTLRAATADEFRTTLSEIDNDLTARIDRLRTTQHRLRDLATGKTRLLPADVERYLDQLRSYGFSSRWIGLQTDLWLLVYATHPEAAADLFQDQSHVMDDPELRDIFLDYDRAHDLAPTDPRLPKLASRIVRETRRRYGTVDQLPGQAAGSAIPALIQDTVNAMSPAWQRLDTLVRTELTRND
jgi:DNA-binding transcriptional MerR regulator